MLSPVQPSAKVHCMPGCCSDAGQAGLRHLTVLLHALVAARSLQELCAALSGALPEPVVLSWML